MSAVLNEDSLRELGENRVKARHLYRAWLKLAKLVLLWKDTAVQGFRRKIPHHCNLHKSKSALLASIHRQSVQ